MRIPKELFKAIREISLNDKKDKFNHGGLFQRVDKIPISKTSNELAAVNFVYYGDGEDFHHIQYMFCAIFSDYFCRCEKEKGQTAEKAAHAVLKKWISFSRRLISYWPLKIPDLYDQSSQDCVMSRTSLYRRLPRGAIRVQEILRGDIDISKTLRYKLNIREVNKSTRRSARIRCVWYVTLKFPGAIVRRFNAIAKSFRANTKKCRLWRLVIRIFCGFANQMDYPATQTHQAREAAEGYKRHL